MASRGSVHQIDLITSTVKTVITYCNELQITSTCFASDLFFGVFFRFANKEGSLTKIINKCLLKVRILAVYLVI